MAVSLWRPDDPICVSAEHSLLNFKPKYYLKNTIDLRSMKMVNFENNMKTWTILCNSLLNICETEYTFIAVIDDDIL